MEDHQTSLETEREAAGPALRPVVMNSDATRQMQARLGRAIRRRRRILDLTLQDLAAACGVTFQQVHKYESGLCSLSASQLWAIAQALHVPIAYLYESFSPPGDWGAQETQVA